MQTQLTEEFRLRPEGREAEGILRRCVHCGFCNATCPTYRVLGDELDGPRGRIYLIKEMLEGAPVTARTRQHLDRCLTCRACETTCPSGVRYGRLLDLGRAELERRAPRALPARLLRRALIAGLSHRRGFAALLALGRALRPWLPAALRRRIPEARRAGAWPPPRQARRMLVLQGCVQPALAPSINAAAARVLDRAGVSLIAAADGCCGALAQHLGDPERARAHMRRNIDAWWPQIERGVEAIVVTASGCGVQVKDYGELLADDPRYADKARRVSALFLELSEAVGREHERLRFSAAPGPRVAFHAPCTLTHGLRLGGTIERMLRDSGCELTPVADAQRCCGSAGTYSILEPRLAGRLRADKLRALQAGAPEVIATANIGCLTHLAAGSERPVRHWIEVLEARLAE